MKEFTTEQLELELIKRYGEFQDDIDKETEKILFKNLKNVDGLSDYLKLDMQNEIMNYFSVESDQQRWIIKGRVSKILSINKNMRLANSDKPDLKNKRYA